MYTIFIKTGVIKRDSDGLQVMPVRGPDDKGLIEYQNWLMRGNTPTPNYSDPMEVLLLSAKENRQNMVDTLTVTLLSNKKVIDANESSQNRMARNIQVLGPSESITWVYPGQVVGTITREELVEALSLATRKTTDIWAAPYLSINPSTTEARF